MDYLVIEIDDKEAGVVKWEDVIDDYGEPEALGANAWMTRDRNGGPEAIIIKIR